MQDAGPRSGGVRPTKPASGFARRLGYRDLAKLALAAERELHRHPIQEVAVTVA